MSLFLAWPAPIVYDFIAFGSPTTISLRTSCLMGLANFAAGGCGCRGYNAKRKATAGRLSDRLLEHSIF
jgi:hypothetical protein